MHGAKNIKLFTFSLIGKKKHSVQYAKFSVSYTSLGSTHERPSCFVKESSDEAQLLTLHENHKTSVRLDYAQKRITRLSTACTMVASLCTSIEAFEGRYDSVRSFYKQSSAHRVYHTTGNNSVGGTLCPETKETQLTPSQLCIKGLMAQCRIES